MCVMYLQSVGVQTTREKLLLRRSRIILVQYCTFLFSIQFKDTYKLMYFSFVWYFWYGDNFDNKKRVLNTFGAQQKSYMYDICNVTWLILSNFKGLKPPLKDNRLNWGPLVYGLENKIYYKHKKKIRARIFPDRQ